MRFFSLVLLALPGLSVDAQEVPSELDYRRVKNFFQIANTIWLAEAVYVRLAFIAAADDV